MRAVSAGSRAAYRRDWERSVALSVQTVFRWFTSSRAVGIVERDTYLPSVRVVEMCIKVLCPNYLPSRDGNVVLEDNFFTCLVSVIGDPCVNKMTDCV